MRSRLGTHSGSLDRLSIKNGREESPCAILPLFGGEECLMERIQLVVNRQIELGECAEVASASGWNTTAPR